MEKRLSPRAAVELALVVICGLLSWAYVNQRDDRLRAEGRVEVAEQRADSLEGAARAAVRATEDRDMAAARVIRRETTARAEAERRAVRAEARLPKASDAVIAAAAPADSAAVRDALSELEALYEERDQARLERIRSDSVVIAELNDLDRTRVTAIRTLEAALAASQAEVDALRDARPGWLERNGPKVLVPLAFVGGWVMRGLID